MHRRHHKSRGRERFYLLPGMGGTALKRKRELFFRWSVLIGLAASAFVAWLLYRMGSR